MIDSLRYKFLINKKKVTPYNIILLILIEF